MSNDTTVWDKTAALKFLEGDQELLDELIQLFIENIPKSMTEMLNAQSRQDYAALAHAAHAIKGMLGNFFAEASYALAFKLEQSARNNQAEECCLASQNLTAALQQLLLAFQRETGTLS